MENMFLAGRITYEDISQQKLLLTKFANEQDIIIYEHHERKDNLHFHFLVANPSKSREDTYAKWVKAIVGGDKVNRKYSFKRMTNGNPVDINFISYMSKGELDPVYVNSINNIFTPAIVEPLKNKGYNAKKGTISKDLKDAIADHKVKTSRITEWSMVQEVIQILPPPQDREDSVWTPDEVKKVAFQVREKNKKLLPPRQAAEFVQKCMYYLNPNQYEDAVDYWLNYYSGKKFS
nr:MAG: hypothetical protein [Chemarfal virus 208]